MEDNGADDDEKKTEEEDKDKEDKEEEKEEEKDSQRELSLLLSKCHAALKRARETVAEASVMRFADDDDVDTQKNAAALTDDDGQKRTLEMMHSMAGRVERMVEECKETLEEIERKTTHLSTKTYRGGDADAKEEKERRRQEFVRAMRTETRTMRRDVEEVLKHAESARKGERRQLIPEPMKEAPKTKDETREEKIQQQQQQHHHQPEDRFLFWKTSAKTYLRKAKKKMDSVATQTKNAVKKYARSKSYGDAEGQQKETERYSDAQRQREMREEEEIRRVRRYGYESTKSTNNLEENVDKDDEDAQRRALFAKIAPTITPIPSTSSLPNNTTTAKNSYDIKAARNSTLSANRSAIALENSLHHAERAERAGRDTLENLRRQRETLQRTSGHVQSATRTADENARLVKKMSHWSRLGC